MTLADLNVALEGELLSTPDLEMVERLANLAKQYKYKDLGAGELAEDLRSLKQYLKQAHKCTVNIRRKMATLNTQIKNPVNKAMQAAATADIDTDQFADYISSTYRVRRFEETTPRIETMLMFFPENDSGQEPVEKRLIKLLPSRPEKSTNESTLIQDEEMIEENETCETPITLKKPTIQSTAAKPNFHLQEELMSHSPIGTFNIRHNKEDGECTLSDSEDEEIVLNQKRPPKTRQVPKLYKSISDSALGTPKAPKPSGSLNKRGANVLTPRGNDRKKLRSKDNDEKKPPKTRIARPGTRNGNSSRARSASKSPTRGMAKTKSLFDLKSDLFDTQKSSLFDHTKGTPKKLNAAERRAEFNEKKRQAEERMKLKREQEEAERKKKAAANEERRQRAKKRVEEQQQAQKEKQNLKKVSKLQKQRELAAEKKLKEAKAEKERQMLEEAARMARIEEEERIKNSKVKHLPIPNVTNSSNLEETKVIHHLGAIDENQVTPVTKKNLMTSYEITPRGADKVDKSTAENYNIDDLSENDETDDDEAPRKAVPEWAQKATLKFSLKQQYNRKTNVESLFSGCYAHQDRLVNLDEVLGNMVRSSRRQYLSRRETVQWAPMVQPNPLLDRTLNLDHSCFPGEEPRTPTY